MHNEQDLKNTPEYRSGMFRIVTCPVCGYPTLDMYWICEHCGWEYDIELQTEDEESPCNGMSLRAYRELYKTGGISMNVTICSRKAAEEHKAGHAEVEVAGALRDNLARGTEHDDGAEPNRAVNPRYQCQHAFSPPFAAFLRNMTR